MRKLYLILAILSFNNPALFAQLSPGKLHKSHAFMEGLENCTKCHVQGEKVNPQKCLACHSLLKEQIDKKVGLHSGSEYNECVKCHVDHIGRDYKMVYWGKAGRKSFDHSKTGYKLSGAHAKLDCEKCHNENNILNPSKLKQKDKNLNSTYLGLGTQCLSCHQNEHRDQLDSNCLSCHDMEKWKKAPGFRHDKTHFQLTGKHTTVKCENCHKTVSDNKYPNDKSYLSFAIQNFNSCQECHKDIHNKRFGSNCTKCHNTSGWHNYSKDNFNHNNTLYPLRGMHSTLQCKQCHKPGKPMKISRYQKCMDCHKDAHDKQFINRKSKGACEECHSVQGFSPSAFSLKMHQLSAYPLEGSHLAVPCIECHKDSRKSSLRKTSIQFRFQNTDCINCHQDVHKGETTKISGIKSCEDCHSVNNWNEVNFDHDKTKFKLIGVHKQAACKKCHINEKSAKSQTWNFKNTKMECISCHNDIHQGQLSKAGKITNCANCHSPVDWFADKFDHEKDARFSLKGAHEYVPCKKCHFNSKKDGRVIAIYKPLDVSCESCHRK